MSLYKLTGKIKEIEELLNQIEEIEEREKTEEIKEYYKEIIKEKEETEDKYKEKIENIIKLIKNKENRLEGIKKEHARLSKLKSVEENKIKWLRDYLKSELEYLDYKNIQTNLYNIRIVRNGGLAPLKFKEGITIENIPSKFIKTEKKIDTDKIRKYLNMSKQPLDFVILSNRETHLSIK